jgi:Pyrimidine dimer DNA glycosylase
MVNTFLTDSDFDKSAQSLDNARLGKQRVEAYQILWLIKDLEYLGRYFQDPIPEDPRLRHDWIRNIARRYKALSSIFVVRGIGRFILYIEFDKAIVKAIPKKSKNVVVIQGHTFYPASDHIISLGFVYHPAVEMWLTFETALKHYINCHIKEWIHRGFVNTMSSYELPLTFIRPKWSHDSTFHQNHRAALINKERVNGENPWYANNKLFVEAGPFDDYIWPLGF